MAWGADDALERVQVTAVLRGRLARGFHDPLDDLGVGELDDDAVPDAPRHAEGPRAVARYLHRDLGQLVADPFELELLLVPLDFSAVHQVLDHPQPGLELRHADRLQADDSAR